MCKDVTIVIEDQSSLSAIFDITAIVCTGGTATVSISTSGVRPIRYSADSGNTYQYDSTFVLPAGVYNFQVIDTNGCAKDSVITITEPAPLFGVYVDSAVHCQAAATVQYRWYP